MNPIRKLSDEVSVSAFVPPQEVPALAGEFRTIVNNRPDSEEPGQPSSAEIEAAARQAGLHYVHIPVKPGNITEKEIVAFAQALTNEPRPLLAFCRSGMRSTALWALAQADKQSADSILETTAAAGFDLRPLKPLIEQRAV